MDGGGSVKTPVVIILILFLLLCTACDTDSRPDFLSDLSQPIEVGQLTLCVPQLWQVYEPTKVQGTTRLGAAYLIRDGHEQLASVMIVYDPSEEKPAARSISGKLRKLHQEGKTFSGNQSQYEVREAGFYQGDSYVVGQYQTGEQFGDSPFAAEESRMTYLWTEAGDYVITVTAQELEDGELGSFFEELFSTITLEGEALVLTEIDTELLTYYPDSAYQFK